MAKANIERTMNVSYEKFFEVISRYEDYPKFLDSVKSTTVERKAPGHARVKYEVTVVKDVWYQIDIIQDQEKGKVNWKLVDSDVFVKNSGSWEIEKKGDQQIHVRYELDVEFKIPVPGFILKRLVSGNLPSMMDQFEKRAKSI